MFVHSFLPPLQRLNAEWNKVILSDKPTQSEKASLSIRGQCTVHSQTPVSSNDKKSYPEILLQGHRAIVIVGYLGSCFEMP